MLSHSDVNHLFTGLLCLTFYKFIFRNSTFFTYTSYLAGFVELITYFVTQGQFHVVMYLLYCIMRPYTEGRLDRYRIGIPRELSEIRTQPWLSEVSLTCDPCHHRGPIF